MFGNRKTLVRKSIGLAVVVIVLGGCAPAAAPLPKALDATSTYAPTPTAEAASPACDLNTILPQVDSALKGNETQADYLTINHQLALSIWLEDPGITRDAAAAAANSRHAVRTGVRMAYTLANEIPCVRSLFEVINPMIVDQDYYGWYIDIIPMQAIPQEAGLTDDDLVSAIERNGMQIAYVRHAPPRGQAINTAAGSCTWMDAQYQILGLFSGSRPNVSAYLIAGYQEPPGGTGPEPIYAQVQWEVATAKEADRSTVLATLEKLAHRLACLTSPVDRLETYVVDARGRLAAYALIPGDVIRAGKTPLDPDDFTLILFQGQ